MLGSLTLLALAVQPSVQAAPAQERGAEPPNLVVFLVDDMGWQDTSLPFHDEVTALNRRYQTPHMERLAADGVMFTDAHASAVCSPSRVSLMTGMNAARHRVTNWTLHRDRSPDHEHPRTAAPEWNLNGLTLPGEAVERSVQAATLPQLLRQAGYHTIHVGKAHFGAVGTPGADPRNLGFDVNIAGHAAGGPGSYHGEHDYSAAWRDGARVWDVPGLERYHGTRTNLTEALTLEALAALDDWKRADGGRPFYLYLSHYTVHAPWEVDRRFEAHYRAQGLEGNALALATMLAGMDESLGQVLSWLDRNRLADDTLVVFLSDNGAPKQVPANLPLRGHKVLPYEGGHRVPMIVRWPGHAAPGARRETPVLIEDVFPSLLVAAGLSLEQLDLPQVVDGRSFLPLLDGQDADQEAAAAAQRDLVWHFPHHYDTLPYSVLRRGRWKLIWWPLEQRAELYDLGADLSEAHDLAAEQPERTAQLRGALRAQLERLGAQQPVDPSTGQPYPLP
jgi:arylsulfatase A-like enzyme